MIKHKTHDYILNPNDKVKVNLIGAGGTGSQVLPHLARIHIALRAMGHTGLDVALYDADTVSEANIGRQMFSINDIGLNKAQILITRLNRFFNLNWKGYPIMYSEDHINDLEKFNGRLRGANITISCVDTVSARREIRRILYHENIARMYNEKPLYWIDCGNSKDYGQIILGTVDDEGHDIKLPDLFDHYPNMEEFSEPDEPSCSLLEAIGKQSIMVNTAIAQEAALLLYNLFAKPLTSVNGVIVNLDKGTFKIPIR